MKSVVIITPTIGSKHLIQCTKSVENQIYENVKHLVVVDGSQYGGSKNIYDAVIGDKQEVIDLKTNVGADGWYGHRIYAAFSYLVNEDFVCFLDEDNWLEPDHIEKMVTNIEQNSLDWTHCLRNIHRKDGTFICQDNCESLGSQETWISHKARTLQQCHVDTSSFMVKREQLVRIAGEWYGQWGADRQFFNTLRTYVSNWRTTPNYTLNYRLDGNPGSVTEEFFIEGNKYMQRVYGG